MTDNETEHQSTSDSNKMKRQHFSTLIQENTKKEPQKDQIFFRYLQMNLNEESSYSEDE